MKQIKAKNSFYTLIEVLTVVVIAAILFGIGIPAFTTMIQGNTMTIAVREFSSKISAARAHAITSKSNVALLLVENETFLGDDGRYSAYRVCAVSASNAFENWIEGEDWKTLPTGALRYEGSGTNGDLITVTGVPMLNADGSAGTPGSVQAVVFRKNGQTVNPNPVSFNLTQGRCVAGSIQYTDRDPSDSSRMGLQPLSINQHTGKVTTGKFDYGK